MFDIKVFLYIMIEIQIPFYKRNIDSAQSTD